MAPRCIFSWLHLSDCHFGHGSAGYSHDQALVLGRLQGDVVATVTEGAVPPPQAVLITGDIANTGASRNHEEYQLALRWFEDLTDILALSPRDVLTVPGNHDVDRAVVQDDRLAFRVLDALRRGASLDEALADNEDRAALLRRMEPYRQFESALGAPTSSESDVCWVHRRTLDRGYELRIAGLNTALLSADDYDSGCLQLGKEQLRTVFLPEAGETTFTLALTHHPFDWLKDRGDAASWTAQHADAHLLGHLHEHATFIQRRTGQPALLEIRAGAVHGDEASEPAHSYNFGALYVDDDDHPVVRTWHRRWSGYEFLPDLDSADDKQRGFGEEVFRRKLTGGGQAESGDPIREASAIMLRTSGSRRTAYPTDLSIAELADRDVLIAPTFSDVVGPPKAALVTRPPIFGVSAITEALENSKSVLVLGEPGSGKSVLAYLVHRQLLESGKLPLEVSITDLAESPRFGSGTLTAAVARRTGGAPLDFNRIRPDAVFLIDGIDEAIASGAPVDRIAGVLNQMPALVTTLATCRTREFEDHLLGRIAGESFGRVVELEHWTMEAEFATFVARLADAELLSNTGILAEVRASPALADLVKRPLLARMLTYVYENDRPEVMDLAGLYSAYLRRLARAIDGRLQRTGCPAVNVYRLWQFLSWHIHSTKLFHQELLPASAPADFLAKEAALPVACAQAIAHGLLDYGQVGPDLRAQYRHYSFFEFLVADHVATTIVERALRDEANYADILGVDLPREIRRHLTRIICRSAPRVVIEPLLNQFRRLATDVHDEAQRLVVGNLIAYVLGRVDTNPTQLERLLREESDDFLRTSLQWALGNVDDREATSMYLRELASNPDLASLNRGYLLYYWGDIYREQSPPYRDDDPAKDWSHTRQRTLALMQEPDYTDREPPSRRALDLATFLDFIRFHGPPATPEEAELIRSQIEALSDSTLESGVRIIAGGTTYE